MDEFNSPVAELYGSFPGLLLLHGTVNASATTPIVENTTYHVWVEWTKGTGANGTMKLYLSTTGDKPELPEAQITTGTGKAPRTMIFGSTIAGQDFIVDRIRVDDIEIGSSPAPVISDIPNQTIPENTAGGPIDFTVGEAETAASNLQLT